MRGHRRCDLGVSCHELHASSRRDVLDRHGEFGHLFTDGGKLALEKDGLAVEDVDGWVRRLGVDQEPSSMLSQHLEDVSEICEGSASCLRVSGCPGRVVLHGFDDPGVDAVVKILEVDLRGAIHGHDRAKVQCVIGRAREDPIPIRHGRRGGGQRRNEIGHNHGVAEPASGVTNDCVEHWSVAQVYVPVVGKGDGDLRSHFGDRNRRSRSAAVERDRQTNRPEQERRASGEEGHRNLGLLFLQHDLAR